MTAGKIEPAFPNDDDLVSLGDKVGDLREMTAHLRGRIGENTRHALAPLLRAMNSYYSNKIEGQHTYPADLEAALDESFSADPGVRHKQELAVAHIRLEERLEPIARRLPWSDLFTPGWICGIHRELYEQLPAGALTLLNKQGIAYGEMQPGALRVIDVEVGNHLGPPHDLVPELLDHLSFRYGNDHYATSKKVIAAGASMHRLSWVHPFADGNGRVSRLHNHLLLAHLGLTDGLWSPMRGLARKHQDYYKALAAADATRRNASDGRGTLSARGLAAYIDFWLEVCLDQAGFMAQQLALDSLEHRYNSLALQIAHDFGRQMVHHRSSLDPTTLGRALYRLFQIGKLERGEFKAMLGQSDRSASRVIAQLIDLRLVTSASRVGSLSPGLPFFSLRFLFPGLWPEAEGAEPPSIVLGATD